MSTSGETHAFLTREQAWWTSARLAGLSAKGTSINNLGEVAGVSSVAGSGLNHLFLYTHGDMRDLGTPVRGESFNTAAINDQGEIVGSAINSSGVPASFIHRGNFIRKAAIPRWGSQRRRRDCRWANIVANGSSHAFVLYVVTEGRST